jgi:hypothetical protein
MMIVVAMEVIFSIFEILVGILKGMSFLSGVIFGVLNVIISGYLFIVLYSLFDVFRKEYERGNTANVHYQAPMEKV